MNIRMMAAAALGAALFVWTVASVGMATLASQINQLGIMLPLVLTLAAVRFALQAAGWRIAMGSSPRPTMAQTLRAVGGGAGAGYTTWGTFSSDAVNVVFVCDD